MRTAAGASGGLTSSTVSSSAAVIWPAARVSLGMGRLLWAIKVPGSARDANRDRLHGHPVGCRDSDTTNLILLCRWHHTAVHEGGVTITCSTDGWRFTLPDGNQLRPWQTAETLAGLLAARARHAAAAIDAVDRFEHPDASIIRPRWAGERFSIHDCVQALFTIHLADRSQHDRSEQQAA